MSDEKPVSNRLLRTVYATYGIIRERRVIKFEDLEKIAHVGRSQLYEHIKILERAGLVKRHRFDRYSYIIAVKYVDREKFEKAILESKKDVAIYDVAKEILDDIRRNDMRADLFGACKIHLEVPEHERMTNDIDLIVLNEDFKYLDTRLESMGFTNKISSSKINADYIYFSPKYKFQVLVTIDGIKHPRTYKLYLDMRQALRTKRMIDLEYAVAGKLLMLPHMRKNEDGEDVVYALAYGNINSHRLTSILEDVVENYPEALLAIKRNIGLTMEYLASEGFFSKYHVEKIKRTLEHVVNDVLSKEHTSLESRRLQL